MQARTWGTRLQDPSSGQRYGDCEVTRIFVTVLALIAFQQAAFGDCKDALESSSELKVDITATKSSFKRGEDVAVVLKITNISKNRILVTRRAFLKQVTLFEVLNEKGGQVDWKGVIPSVRSKRQSFTVLNPGQFVTFKALLWSPFSEVGYKLIRKGNYRLRAEYGLSPPEYYAPIDPTAKVSRKTAVSKWINIRIE